MVPRGSPGPQPLVTYESSPLNPLLWWQAREAHPKSFAQNANKHLLGLECFYIDIPFNHPLLSFNLYPIPLECCANVLHKFCIVWFMQSAFTIRNMDSNSEPPSPNMAAAVPDKRRFRKCNNCMSRRPSIMRITILYALNAESQYVTCKLFVNNRLCMKRKSKQR